MVTAVYDLERFKLRSFHSSTAHIPPGGLGCFAASYDPRTQIMDIVVKVCPRFVGLPGQEVAESTKKRFLDAFDQRIPEFWNNRFQFTCTKRDFEGVKALPRFRVVVTDIANAHYDLKVVDQETGKICVRTGEDPGLASLKDKKWDPYRGKLSAQFAMQAISADQLVKAGQMFNAIEAPVRIAYGTVSGQAKLSMAAMERLHRHAKDLEFIFRGLVAPKLTITGPGGDGKTAADAVGSILKTFGFAGKINTAKNGPPGFVKVELSAKEVAKARTKVSSGVQNFPHFAQYAVVHEFGHMLGLPDEYMCCGTNTVSILASFGLAALSSDEREAMTGNSAQTTQDFTPGIDKSQVEFVRLCQAFRVPTPPFGRANPSLMSTGHEFLPAHGVTALNSLVRMTHHYFAPQDWRIDMLR